MSKKKIQTPVSAEVLIHNHGRTPSEETKSKIMDFIQSHKEETMALTPDSLPEPQAEERERHSIEGLDDDDGSTGETAKGS